MVSGKANQIVEVAGHEKNDLVACGSIANKDSLGYG